MWERKIEEQPQNRVSLVIFLSRTFLSMFFGIALTPEPPKDVILSPPCLCPVFLLSPFGHANP
jgi:hypothetical protein